MPGQATGGKRHSRRGARAFRCGSLPLRGEMPVIAALVVTSALVWAALLLRVMQFVFDRADEDSAPARRLESFAAMALAFGFLFAVFAGAGALVAAMIQTAPELGAISGIGVVAVARGAVCVTGLSRAWDA